MDATARLLLHDAMERVAANPTASLSWHRLLACFETIDDADLRHAVCAGLMAITPAHGIAGFLRATFLAGATGEEGHIADAARALQHIRPPRSRACDGVCRLRMGQGRSRRHRTAPGSSPACARPACPS